MPTLDYSTGHRNPKPRKPGPPSGCLIPGAVIMVVTMVAYYTAVADVDDPERLDGAAKVWMSLFWLGVLLFGAPLLVMLWVRRNDR
jgi:FtsH-binding integral membrane protein